MLNRRNIVVALASMPALGAARAAVDRKSKYPELVFAVIPAENASGVVDRFTPFMNYLTKEIGTKVTLRIANDYAAVIEGQRAGNIHIGYYGPASFARALVTGVQAEAFAIDVNHDGSKGYYSVLYVKADAPYKSLADLKGKNLALVDPNSTSGNNMPRFVMNEQHIDPESYFGKVVFAGSHENSVLALAQGTVDICADWWNNENDSNLTRMLSKGMLKNADGSPMKKEDFRILVKSPMIINSPYAYLADMPADLKASVRQAFFDAPVKDKSAFDRLSDGKNQPWQPIANGDYDKIVELIKFVDTLRKKRS
ncbi:MAG: phosphonate ABC transporter substrate-binding protein [Hyphomicrobiales bacterium]|nr:phosphonate ABC transporter substrate-binding protein [Hyphomicrobiales bacterium]